jgi:hypothetical protein
VVVAYIDRVSWIGRLESTRDGDCLSGTSATSSRNADLGALNVELRGKTISDKASSVILPEAFIPEEERQGMGYESPSSGCEAGTRHSGYSLGC